MIDFHLFKMKILFCNDSLYSEVPKRVLTKGLNAKILKISIPGSTVMELGLALVYRIRAMKPPPKILLLSAGTNNASSPIDNFYKEIKKILEFCVSRKILFLMLPIPYSKMASDKKINEMNNLINQCSYYDFNLQYSHQDLSFDRLHLTDECIKEKLKKLKIILNLSISNLKFGEEKCIE